MLSVSIEYVSYQKLTAIKDIHFTLDNGKSLLVTGCSGSGKSTLLLLIANLLEKKNGIDFDAKITIQNIENLQIAYISQNPAANLITNDVKSELALNGGENFEDINKALVFFNFPKYLIERKTRQLSGGEQQLLSIVCAYLRKSSLYLIDEPTEMLDSENKKIVINAIQDLKQSGKTIIIASHEKDIWNEFDQYVDLNGKNNIYNPSLLKEYPSPFKESKINLEINRLTFCYIKNEPIFTNINAKVKNGELVLIEGRNGSGKTTLAKLIATLIKSRIGCIKLNGIDVNKIKSYLPSYLSFSFQNPNNQLLFSTIQDEIEFCPNNYNSFSDNNIQSVFQAINNVNLDKKNDPRETSFGQRRFLTNFSFYHFSPIHIFDEPNIGTDKIMQKYFFDYFKLRQKLGLITILITHNPKNYKSLITQRISLNT